MDNEALVDQINRCLSFEVVAVPEDVFQRESTSKVTPLNVKIKVRKKNDTGLRHGVITMPKVDNRCEKRPERIRLVSSDQTIMSFNVEMEAVFDKMPQKHHNQNLNLAVADQRNVKDNFDEPKKDDNHNVTHNFSKRNKDIFGKCKPGGCLDPPFGEEKYAYKPTTPGVRPPAKDDPTKLKSSSIFKNKLFSRKKRSSHASDISKADLNTEKINSVQSLQEHLSQSSTNSIITYPHPSSSSDIRISEDKSYRYRFSSENKSKNSAEDNSYFILPKKSKNSDNRSSNGNTFPKETLANELIKHSDEHFLRTSHETNDYSSNIDSQTDESVNKKNKNVVQTTTNLIDNNILKVESQIYKWIKSGDNNTLPSSKANYEGNTLKTQCDQSELDKPILPFSVECTDDECNIVSLESQPHKFDKLEVGGTLLVTDNDNNERSKIQISELLAEDSPKLSIENEVPKSSNIDKDNSNIKSIIPLSSKLDKTAYNNTFFNTGESNNDETTQSEESTTKKRVPNRINSNNDDKNILSQKLQSDKLNKLETDNTRLSFPSSNNIDGNIPNSDELDKPVSVNIVTTSSNINEDNSNTKSIIPLSSKLDKTAYNNTFFNTGESNNEENTQSEESTTKKRVPNRIDSNNDDKNILSQTLQSDKLNKLETDNTRFSIPVSNNIEGNIPNSDKLDKPGSVNIITTDSTYFKNNDSSILKLNAACDALHESETNDFLLSNADYNKDENKIDYLGPPSNKSDKYKNDNIVPNTTYLNNYDGSIQDLKSYSDTETVVSNKDYNNTLSSKLSQPGELIEPVNGLDNALSKTGACNDDNSNIRNIEIESDELSKSINKINISNSTYFKNDDTKLNSISHSDESDKPDTGNTVFNTHDPINDTSNDSQLGLQSDDLDKKAAIYDSNLKVHCSELDTSGNEYKPKSTDFNNSDNNIVNKSESDKAEALNGNIILNSASSNNDQSLNFESYSDERSKLAYQNVSGDDDLNKALNASTDSYTNNNISDTLEIYENKDIVQKNLKPLDSTSSLFNNISSAADNIDLIINEPSVKKIDISYNNSSNENMDTTILEQIQDIENSLYDMNQTKSSTHQDIIPVVGMNDMEGVNKIEETISIIETNSATEDKSTLLIGLERRESLLDVTKEISNPVFHGRASYSNNDYESFNSSTNDLTEIWENDSAAPTSTSDVIALGNIDKGILLPLKIHKLSDLPETNVNKENLQSTPKVETDLMDAFMSTEYGVNIEKKASKLDPSENFTISEVDAVQNMNGADTGMKTNTDSNQNKDMIDKDGTDYSNEHKNVSVKLSLSKISYLDLVAENTAPVILNEGNPALKILQKETSANDAGLEGNYTIDTDKEIATFQQANKATIFQDGKAPWKVNVAFRSYIDENNDRVIKSYDSENVSERRKRDTLIVAQCFMCAETNELKVPIDGENDLRLQIINKKLNAAIFIDTSVQTDACPEIKKIELNLANPKNENTDLQEKLTAGERKVPSKVNQNAIIQDNVRNSLNKIYEHELLPLQATIKGLREEIESLAVYEMKFRENVHKLIPKKTRPLRLVPSNRRCACNRKL